MTLTPHLSDDLKLSPSFRFICRNQCCPLKTHFSSSSYIFQSFTRTGLIHSLPHLLIQPSFNPILLALEEVGSGITKEQGDTVPEESFCGCHQTISIDSCFSLSPVPLLIILQSLSHNFLKHSSDSCTPLLNNHKCIPSIGKKPTKTKRKPNTKDTQKTQQQQSTKQTNKKTPTKILQSI